MIRPISAARLRWPRHTLLAICGLFAACAADMLADEPILPKGKVAFFEKSIRPILVKRCYECHGPEEASGKLRLDMAAGWKRGGASGPAIVPGDPSSSLLYRALTHTDKQLKMPPSDSGGMLSKSELADFAKWIRDGAIDPRTGKALLRPIDAQAREHWAFQPLNPPDIPPGQHGIDHLIARQLQSRGFKATGPAEMRTLVRRATYDLHGLPPTQRQFRTDKHRYAKLIDELLASPRYGERWARHWLDVARYSDAKDGVLMYGDARIRPFAYTYRDYVIRSFNEDKPFDQFVREQLAADKLKLPADSPALAAMGFLTLGRMFDNNPHDVIDDQIDVVTRGFLGLTVSCARCHDHKFDPIPTADYYSLHGVFASSLQPLARPRIQAVNKQAEAHEKELKAQLTNVLATRDRHYAALLETARRRTPEYLVQVATTEPDISETAVFFLSLLPNQLRPQITYKWRKLIARRSFPDDPLFGPWHDMMQKPVLRPDVWRKRGVDKRIITALVQAKPKTPAQIARVYGETIRGVWGRKSELEAKITAAKVQVAELQRTNISLAEVVGRGAGNKSGQPGRGIRPDNGEPVEGAAGFIEIKRHDKLVPVPHNPFVDGVFVPKSGTAVISSTDLKLTDLPKTGGQTWDYFKFGPSSGGTVSTIDGVDYRIAPNRMLAMHANKGITFDLQNMRKTVGFQEARFQAVLGHGGAKDQSQIDFFVYLDGKRVVTGLDFKAQSKGLRIDVPLPKQSRFLTLVVTEGKQGISHDQAILGNPRITFPATTVRPSSVVQRIAALQKQVRSFEAEIQTLPSLKGDPIAELLLSRDSPVWFPKTSVYLYLSRQDKDAFRGMVNGLDSISVKHAKAAARAMTMVDADPLYAPVIFMRGDPGHPGPKVERQFLSLLSPDGQKPFAGGSGRLDLANAITSPQNPLTARVWANRVWLHHFGEPLVENPSDFGLRTQRPLQYELLDYLASQLIVNGWQTKPLHRLIMTSQAYQRSSRIGALPSGKKQLEGDPNNALLWRANRRRLDLEQMRDSLLMLSGRIDLKMFGRPTNITDVNNARRTVYCFVERQNVPSVVKTFDFANADTSTARRVATTVPQQALYFMNSPFVAKATSDMAKKFESTNVAQAGDKLYRHLYGRPASKEELELAKDFVSQGSWTDFVQVLLMTNEFMFVD